MRRRSLLAAVGLVLVLSVISFIGTAPARSAPAGATTATSAAVTRKPVTRTALTRQAVTPTSVAPTPSGASTASGGSHSLTRTERAILLVTLTFLVGAGLLGAPDGQEETRSTRPAITLYDDPALLERATPTPRPAGEPPPLR